MERLLKNPGLVENAPDQTSCFLACIQMFMRTKNGGRVYSFDEIDAIQNRKPGYYSWEFAMLERLAREGFEIENIWDFSLKRFLAEKEDYLLAFYGAEGAADVIRHSDMDAVMAAAKAYSQSAMARYSERMPTLDDIRHSIDAGWYMIANINQHVLQANPGVGMHSVFVYGYSERGVRLHNPGPPATEASEIAWDLFDKAWSSPNQRTRQLIRARSCEKVS